MSKDAKCSRNVMYENKITEELNRLRESVNKGFYPFFHAPFSNSKLNESVTKINKTADEHLNKACVWTLTENNSSTGDDSTDYKPNNMPKPKG